MRWIGIDARLEPRPGGLFRFEIAKGDWCSGRDPANDTTWIGAPGC